MFRPLLHFPKPMKIAKPSIFSDHARMEYAAKINVEYVVASSLKEEKDPRTVRPTINK